MVTNRFSFIYIGHKVNLKPLSPREVIDDKSKNKVEKRGRSKERRKTEKMQKETLTKENAAKKIMCGTNKKPLSEQQLPTLLTKSL
ncbi:hypothetical protein CR513_13406, partial [Mucuna pruriens]